MKGEKVIHWGGNGVYILLRYPSNNYTFMAYIGSYLLLPPIHSIFYVTTALLQSDMFRL